MNAEDLAALLRHHYAHQDAPAELIMDGQAECGEPYPFARSCSCGLVVLGTYEYLDHLLGVLEREEASRD